MKYYRVVKKSQAKNYISGNKLIKSDGAQASYNLPKEFFLDAKDKGVLVETSMDYPRKYDDGNAYILNSNYKFKLGQGVLWLIGEEYKNIENKFILSKSGTNNKIITYRTVYNQMSKNDRGYKWFVDLYDKNLAGNKLIFNIDEDRKIFTWDIEFSGIEQNLTYDDIQPDKDECVEYSHNMIYYGAPGTGKSFDLEKKRKEVLEDDDYYFERVTFHPDYSYGDFVGTYKPFVEKNNENKDEITYKFIPGSFLRVLIKALKDPEHLYMLIIEEINRADVYSVFGDVFQLLDRDKDNKSVYSIDISEDVKKYFKDHKIELEKLEIPRNMLIWATMNSADQGVFPVDTAFKRRWDFEYLSLDNNQEENTGYIHTKTGDYEWNDIRTTINNYLLKEGINEDKCMGPFFINNESNDDYTEMFKNKVLMYLFEDAARPLRQRIFSDYDVLTFSNIITDFNGEKGMHIFNDEIVGAISKDSDLDDEDINDTQ